MRFVLRQGSREVIFFSENRFMRFEDPETAADFLLDYLIQADNLSRLREALSRHQTWSWLAQRDDGTVLDETARLLTTGMMHLMADPDALMPWTWQFRSPSFPIEVVQSETEFNPLVALEDAMEELEAEIEDLIPDAILPPTFIQVAEMEAKGIEFLEKMYEMAMDLLRFVGLEGELPSELAPEYNETAKTNGDAINQLTESFTAQLDPLVVGGLDDPGVTQAGEAMLKLAESQGFGVKEITETMGETLETLTQGPGDLPAPTEVGPLLLDEAVKQGTNLGEIAQETAETLAFLARPDMPELRPTEVGPELAEIATLQANMMAEADEIVRQELALMASSGAFELPPPTVPEEMRNIAGSQGQGVMESTLLTMQQFQQFLAKVPPEPQAVSQLCQQFQATMELQVASLTQGADFVGGEIRGLTMVALPEAHDPSPVGDAFIESAEDQTAGMIRAALAAGESLAGLALPAG